MQLLCWLSWSGFELLLAEVKSGCCKLLATFPTAPAHFQWRSARVTTLCGFHLAHCDLRRDRHGSKQLRCVLRPTSPSGLLGEILIAFPSRKKKNNTEYVLARKSQEERMALKSPIPRCNHRKGTLVDVNSEQRRTNLWCRFAEITPP